MRSFFRVIVKNWVDVALHTVPIIIVVGFIIAELYKTYSMLKGG